MLRSIDANIAGVESRFGRVFNNKSFCATALQMESKRGIYLNFAGSTHLVEHNRRYELQGDRALDTVLCKKWIQARDADGHRHPIESWDAMRNSLVENAALEDRALQLGLDAFIVTNHGTTATRKMVGKTFEAIIGAVFLDAGDDGLKAVHDVLEHIGFFNHPMLSLPNMEDSRIGDKRNSGVAYEKGPKALLVIY